MRTPNLILPLLVLFLLAAPACMKAGETKKKDEDDGKKETPLVRVGPLRRLTLDRNLEITGTVEATAYVAVNPRIEDAEILELKADIGDRVAAGDVLATFDATDATMILDDAKALHGETTVEVKNAEVSLRELRSQAKVQSLVCEQAQKSLDRAKAQAEKGAISQEALDAFQYKRDQESAQCERMEVQIEKAQVAVDLALKSQEKAALGVARAERKVSWAVLRAPIGGIVAKRSAAKGQQTLFTSLARGALFEIFDPSSLVVNAQVTQRDLPFVRVGLPVEIRSDACPGVSFEGAISVVSPVIDSAAGTVPIRIAIKDQERLKPGLFVSGRVVLEAKPNALVVPRKAVLYERERPYVMKIVSEGDQVRVSRVFFREGLSGKEDVEALADAGAIGDSDKIVLVGHDRLRDGDTVKIEKPAGPGPAESKPAAPSHGG